MRIDPSTAILSDPVAASWMRPIGARQLIRTGTLANEAFTQSTRH